MRDQRSSSGQPLVPPRRRRTPCGDRGARKARHSAARPPSADPPRRRDPASGGLATPARQTDRAARRNACRTRARAIAADLRIRADRVLEIGLGAAVEQLGRQQLAGTGEVGRATHATRRHESALSPAATAPRPPSGRRARSPKRHRACVFAAVTPERRTATSRGAPARPWLQNERPRAAPRIVAASSSWRHWRSRRAGSGRAAARSGGSQELAAERCQRARRVGARRQRGQQTVLCGRRAGSTSSARSWGRPAGSRRARLSREHTVASLRDPRGGPAVAEPSPHPGGELLVDRLGRPAPAAPGGVTNVSAGSRGDSAERSQPRSMPSAGGSRANERSRICDDLGCRPRPSANACCGRQPEGRVGKRFWPFRPRRVSGANGGSRRSAARRVGGRALRSGAPTPVRDPLERQQRAIGVREGSRRTARELVGSRAIVPARRCRGCSGSSRRWRPPATVEVECEVEARQPAVHFAEASLQARQLRAPGGRRCSRGG